MTSYWAVAQTVTTMEHIVRREIEKTNRGTFLPTKAHFWKVDGRDYAKEYPLMGGYVFFLTSGEDWAGIPDIHGVYGVLANSDRTPKRVSGAEMNRMVISHAAGLHNETLKPRYTKYYRKPEAFRRKNSRKPRPGNRLRNFAVLWRKRHKGRKVTGRAVLTALGGVVIALSTVPNSVGALAGPYEDKKAEIGSVGGSENIIVKYSPIYVENLLSGRDSAKVSDVAIPVRDAAVESLLPRPDTGYAGHWHRAGRYQRVIEVGWYIGRHEPNPRYNPHIVGRSGAIVSDNRPKFEDSFSAAALSEVRPSLNGDVGPQLPFGGPISTSYELKSGIPEHPSNDPDKPFSRLNTQDRGLGSVLAAVLTLWLASFIFLRGWTVLGGIAAAYAIFGLLLGLDLWSLAVRVL